MDKEKFLEVYRLPALQRELDKQEKVWKGLIIQSLKHPPVRFNRESALIMDGAQKIAARQPPVARPSPGHRKTHDVFWNGAVNRNARVGPIWDQVPKTTLANNREALDHMHHFSMFVRELKSRKALEKYREEHGHPPPPFKNGGLVKKTGLALVHKGELVIPANRVEAVTKAVKKAGLKPLKK